MKDIKSFNVVRVQLCVLIDCKTPNIVRVQYCVLMYITERFVSTNCALTDSQSLNVVRIQYCVLVNWKYLNDKRIQRCVLLDRFCSVFVKVTILMDRNSLDVCENTILCADVGAVSVLMNGIAQCCVSIELHIDG
jgi:hypothetical protein